MTSWKALSSGTVFRACTRPRAFYPLQARSFSRAPSCSSAMSVECKLSAGQDEEQLRSKASELTVPRGKWNLSAAGTGLERTFRFKTFKAAFEFMTRVSQECKTYRHHPEWSNVYNTVFIRWTTHDPPGLSDKDTQLAVKCDEIASSYDILQVDPSRTAEMGSLADEVAGQAGDCCKPQAPQIK